MLAIYTLVFVAVCALVWIAVMRGRRHGSDGAGLSHAQQRGLVLTGGVAVPAAVLIGFIMYSVAVSRTITVEPNNPLKVEVVGHQWWWEVSYPNDDQPDLAFTTANEIHLLVGRPALIEIKSRDVIHSFWVPNLHGKTDAVPGRTNRIWLQADTPGTWRGQCAEYCGLQHAHMAMTVTAHSASEFDAWVAAQLQPAPEPTDASAIRGRDVFLTGPCVLCHTIRGTIAHSRFGPDLTHVASRRTLAAGTVPNTRGYLAGWILDPHNLKPGVRMPPTNLRTEDLSPLLSYLETLK